MKDILPSTEVQTQIRQALSPKKLTFDMGEKNKAGPVMR